MSSPTKSMDFHIIKTKPKQYRPLDVYLHCEYNKINYNYNRKNINNKIVFENFNSKLNNIQNYERNYLYGIIHILKNIESTKRTITIYLNNVYTKTLIKEFLNVDNSKNINNDLILELINLQNIKYDILLKHKI